MKHPKKKNTTQRHFHCQRPSKTWKLNEFCHFPLSNHHHLVFQLCIYYLLYRPKIKMGISLSISFFKNGSAPWEDRINRYLWLLRVPDGTCGWISVGRFCSLMVLFERTDPSLYRSGPNVNTHRKWYLQNSNIIMLQLHFLNRNVILLVSLLPASHVWSNGK